jgi:hypothetical protein
MGWETFQEKRGCANPVTSSENVWICTEELSSAAKLEKRPDFPAIAGFIASQPAYLLFPDQKGYITWSTNI